MKLLLLSALVAVAVAGPTQRLISVGPAIVDNYQPAHVEPALVDEYSPIHVGPAIVDEYQPAHVEPALIDEDAASHVVVDDSGSPIVKIIVNINKADQNAEAEVVQAPEAVEDYQPIVVKPALIDEYQSVHIQPRDDEYVPSPDGDYHDIDFSPPIIDWEFD